MESEGEQVIDFADVDAPTMTELLRFIYCGKVNDLGLIAHKLIYAAEKFQMTELKELCSAHIKSTLNVGNVVDAWLMTDRINGLDDLHRCCLHIIVG